MISDKVIKYSFHYQSHCNMCGSDSVTHKILGKRLNQSQGKNPKKKSGISTTIVKCLQCGLIYSNPQPIPYSLQDHYGFEPNNYWNQEYFSISPSYFEEEIKRLQQLIKFHPGIKALDIGAGIGKCMIALEKAGMDAFGIEPSETFYKLALEKMKINPEKLKLSSLENAVFPENNFDFITFGAVIEHLYDPSSAMQKAITWLKPNGIIQIEVPSSRWAVNKIANFYYSIIGTDYVANLSPMHKPFHLFEFDLKSFQYNGKRNQYSIAHHEYYVCKTYMPKLLDFILIPYMQWTKTGMQLCVWLRKN